MKKMGQLGGHYYLYRSVLSIIAGILLVSFPDVALIYVVYLIGTITLLFGIVTLLSLNKHKSDYSEAQKGMMTTNAVINLILGIFLITAPTFFINFLMTVIGVVIILAGAFQMYLLYQRRKVEGVVSMKLFVLPLIIFLSGLFVTFYPFSVVSTLVVVMGTIIIFYGIVELLVRARIKELDK